ncbi:MAG TPA: arsenite methyltransferase [Candidatus Bathyarchaeia archaeon]
MKEEKVRKMVREGYGKIAKTEQCGCGCGSGISQQIGYSSSELESVPEGADLGLGCGNPVALASLREGETVIDLGSGAGLDCFLAAKKVGASGKVIGVDMTSEMLDKARANCRKSNYKNVEFRLGEIENLPVADGTADVIISNCVINLSPEKQRVFNEAFRVLKAGGRLMVSDMVLLKDIPEAVKKSVLGYIGCVSGAEMKNEYMKMIENAGFREVKIINETHLPLETVLGDATGKAIMDDLKLTKKSAEELVGSVVSVKISATRPQK